NQGRVLHQLLDHHSVNPPPPDASLKLPFILLVSPPESSVDLWYNSKRTHNSLRFTDHVLVYDDVQTLSKMFRSKAEAEASDAATASASGDSARRGQGESTDEEGERERERERERQEMERERDAEAEIGRERMGIDPFNDPYF
ncbi:hypothetical protein KIPB_007857, partial [Kipferlia bialata]